MSKAGILLLIFIIPLRLKSQVLPQEGSKLNYRLIGFSFPQVPEAIEYKIQIAKGNYNTEDSFRKNTFNSIDCKINKVIVEVPAFGENYTWRVVFTKKNKAEKGALRHFSTQMHPHIDTTMLRLRILQPAAEQYKDNYVAVDGGGVLYDMNGRAVWYIPDTNGFTGNVACLQFTPEGTITFIYKEAYEINLNGDILWKSPELTNISGDTTHELFHHELTKLTNGHYMALGMQYLQCKSVSSKDTSYILVAKNDPKLNANGYKQGRFGRLIEYDKKGIVVWSWDCLKYLLQTDFAYYNPIDSFRRFDAHENAFFFDEKNKVIYLGFRDLNRIIKIEYPGGKVLRTYGKIFKPGVQGLGEGLFCGQHSIGLSSDGYLYIFNNNTCKPDSTPTIVMLQEPIASSGTLKKVWEYTCVADGKFTKNFINGGNAKELPDHSLFVNMGSKYCKLSIVDREQKVLWSALPERYIPTERRWVPIYEYRANIISRKSLENLIWTSENQENFK